MLHIWVTVVLDSLCVSSGKEMETSQQRRQPVVWEAQPVVPPAILSFLVGHQQKGTGYEEPLEFASVVHFDYLAIYL